MAIKSMGHIGMVVEDLPAATEFFVQLGLELLGEARSRETGRAASSGSTTSVPK